MKNNLFNLFICRQKHHLLVIKIFFILFLTSIPSAYAFESESHKLKVTINGKDITVSKAIEEIEKQTELLFVYDKNEIDTKRKISLSVKNESITITLNKIFDGTNISYQIIGRNIILQVKDKPSDNGSNKRLIIKGKVVDQNDEPIIGANVIEKGTSNGTITDVDGNYTLKLDKPAKLTVSYLGYNSKELSANKEGTYNVTLFEDAKLLEEVIVVGYGTMKKSDVTGSISSVDIGNVSDNPVASVDQLLKGRSAGVYASTMSSEPGGTTNVVIRGASSLSGNNQPLYVIDGIPIDAATDVPNPFGDNYQAPTNALSMLNPQDIESMEVLKDASATAIYGSRGANGVVLITTKNGKEGKLNINISSSLSISNVIKKIDVLTGPEFARYRNEALTNSGADIIYDGINNPSPDEVNWVNWQDEVLRQAISQDHRISLSSGDKNSSIFISGGFSDNQGIIDNTEYKKADFRINYNKKFNDRLKVTTAVSFANIDANMSETNGNGGSMNRSAIRSMISKSPITDVISDYDEEDMLENNPKNWVTDYTDEGNENTLNMKLDLQYDIIKWLDYQIRTGYNYQQKERSRYYGRTIYPGKSNNGLAGYSNFKNVGIVVENLIHFKNLNFGKHSLDGILGVTFSQTDYKTYSVQASNFPDDILRANNLSLAEVYSPSHNNRYQSRLLSYLARVNYQYNSRYSLTLSFRADGSSKFAPGNKFSYFPSAAFAWRINEEEFMKDFTMISNLKLRLGWGLTGNQGINPYATLPVYSNTQYTYGSTISSGLHISNLKNLQLKWENSQQTNLGIDIGFFNNQLNIVADIYKKRSKDMLIYKNLPPSTGFTKTWVNFGEISNKGFELSVDAALVNTKSWKVNLGGSFSLNRNEISKLGLPESPYGYVQYFGTNIHNDGDIQSPANTFIEGKPIGLFWGYKTAGVYQSEDEINAWIDQMEKVQGSRNENFLFGVKPQPGDIIFVDHNNDGKINQLDKQIIGNPNPDFVWGINGDINFKNFNLSFLFNGVQGRDILNANLNRETTLSGDYYNIRTSAWEGRWTGPGTSNYYPKAYMSIPYRNQVVDRWVEDGSYIRLSNITLGYTWKFKTLKYIQDLKLFISGNNLLTFTNYSGFDPEVDSFAGDSSRMGIDNNSYPSTKSWRFGININF